jgi:hypothetical protein
MAGLVAAIQVFPALILKRDDVRQQRVIASEEKQSRGGKARLDCFVASAPRNDDIEPSMARS